ncbi:MAG TPA: PP2C family protein-serine/threonine phosphatase [Vicinamibacteria bacterium]|nr:PP2C family protein-serine/threonine phosphatase [Vicinamibacteria bacterium]
MAGDSMEQLARELENFQEIASYIKPKPGDVPALDGFDIHGESLPLNGLVGGDHIIYLDFKKRYDLEARITHARAQGLPEVAANLARCQRMVGVVLVDVSGHQVTDGLLAAMLHQSFLLGSLYELDVFGHVTNHLFENLNTRFYKSSSIHKFITMIYGEITEDARFRFISAAHPAPIVFSRLHDRFMESEREAYVTCPPLGTLPSQNVIDRNTTQSVLGFKEAYELNEWEIMGAGDILLLYTDGLSEHADEENRYFPGRLEAKVRELKDRRARDIVEGIRDDILSFAQPSDDISLIVIKRT